MSTESTPRRLRLRSTAALTLSRLTVPISRGLKTQYFDRTFFGVGVGGSGGCFRWLFQGLREIWLRG